MDLNVSRFTTLLKSIGEPNRLRILALLSRGELAVGELAQILDQSQPRLSHHLKALSSVGLVERMPEGAWVFYSLPASGPMSEFIRMMISQVDAESDELARDARRLALVKQARRKAAENYFEVVAEDWDKVRQLQIGREDVEARLLKLAGEGPFKRVIDIGTGTGRMLRLFAEHAERLDGLDLSHRMLTVARSNLDRDTVSHAHVRQGDASDLPYEDGVADIIVIHHVLHFLDEPERVIQEAGRVLSKTGKLLIVDFAPHTLEFLRAEHGHRHLGVRNSVLSDWSARAGLTLSEPIVFSPPKTTDQGLTVQIWVADAVANGAVSDKVKVSV